MANETQTKSVSRKPANPIVGLRDEIDQVFSNFMRGWPRMDWMAEFEPFQLTGSGLAPSVDVSETDKSYEIKAELPGVDSKDIELTLKDNVLSLKAEKKSERDEQGKDYHLSERRYGVLQRSFQLPDNADADAITTAFSQGVLTITLPKTEKVSPSTRRIEVKTD